MAFLTGALGRILFALPFIIFGAFHFINAGAMSGMVPAFMPARILWVYITGAALIAGGVAFITGIKGEMAAILMALLLLIFILTIHARGLPNQASMVSLLKDVGLIGGCLMLAGHFRHRT